MRFVRFIFISICCLVASLTWSQEIEIPKGDYEFFENKGQWPNGVLYRAKLPAGSIWLEQGRILYHFTDYSEVQHVHANPHAHVENTETHSSFKQDVVAARFLDCNENVLTETKYQTPYYQNYFLGNNSKHWAENVYGYHHVKYNQLYNAIDLLVFEKENQLKYEFHVKPGANTDLIKVQYEGHQKIKIDQKGNLIITSKIGEIQENKPYAYQIKNGKIIEVSCAFVLKNDVVTYDIGDYDHDLELILDPELIFSTFCGSVTDNFGMTATYAYDGKGYNGGIIYGNAYPTPGPAWNTTSNITVADVGSATTDVFVSKYSEDGTAMLWTNFIGGGDNTQGTETVHSLICDKDNNVYLYGATSSTDFPIEGGFQTDHGGGDPFNVLFNGTNFGSVGTDIYIAKFSSNGLNLLGSTYIGGSANDGVNFKISSGTYSSAAAYDSLTTNYGDQFRGEIMIDSLGNIIVTSSSWSTDFPTENPFQPTNGGDQDAVVFKVSADFSTLMWSSYFGGSLNDAGYSVKIDSSYNVVFAGGTTSSDLIGVAGGINPTFGGGTADGYVAKINEDGDAILQATYIGTSSYDQVFFVEIDRWGKVWAECQLLQVLIPIQAALNLFGN